MCSALLQPIARIRTACIREICVNNTFNFTITHSHTICEYQSHVYRLVCVVLCTRMCAGPSGYLVWQICQQMCVCVCACVAVAAYITYDLVCTLLMNGVHRWMGLNILNQHLRLRKHWGEMATRWSFQCMHVRSSEQLMSFKPTKADGGGNIMFFFGGWFCVDRPQIEYYILPSYLAGVIRIMKCQCLNLDLQDVELSVHVKYTCIRQQWWYSQRDESNV